MVVLHVNAVYGLGSTGTIVKDLHELSIEHGIESHVAYAMSDLNKSDVENSYVIGNIFDRKCHAIMSRINGGQAYFSYWATRKLLRHLDSIKPDIVHLHNLHSNYINLNMLLKYLGNKKISTIITLHDCWFFTGGCFHYTKDWCDRWQQSCGMCPKKRKDTPAYFFDRSKKILEDRKRYFSQIADLTVVGVSEWISQEAKKSFLSEAKIFTIHNGVDMNLYHPIKCDFRKRNYLEGKFLVLGTANKWLDPINRNLLELFEKELDAEDRLIIIGCNDAQKRQLSEKIIGLSYVNDKEELRGVYSSCDVFVNCTREESLSLVNVESQACGTPVITYSNTGVKETVDGTSGYRIENGDITSMLKQVMKIKQHGKWRYSDNCRQFVLKKFEKKAKYSQYIDLYKDILESREKKI